MDERQREDAPRRVTLQEVAARAGYSVATVSKVLNLRPDVSEHTRQRVLGAAKALDYSPRAVRSNASIGVVEIVVDSIAHPCSSQILEGVIMAGAEAGVELSVHTNHLEVQKDAKWAREMVDRGRIGIIFITSAMPPPELPTTYPASSPVVVVDSLNGPRTDTVNIGATNWAGAFEAANHLIDLGHERMGFVGGPRISHSSQERYHGFRAALETAELELEPALRSWGAYTYDSGMDSATRQLQLRNPPTAIFAASDAIALGVIEGARSLSVSVPEELSIVGFDDTKLASWSSPPLTTIRQPLEAMGNMALQTVLQLHQRQTVDYKQIQLSTSLTVRGSTAAPAR